MRKLTAQIVRDAVYGAAIGDAVGVPYEFMSLEEMKKTPATETMKGHGTHHKPSGTWSDDTSMILCTMDYLDERLDYDSIMQAFCRWNQKGEYTTDGDCFDIGNTTYHALYQYRHGSPVLEAAYDDEYSNGNGSLMRIIPAALYISAHDIPTADGMDLTHKLSRLTHAHIRSQMGCGIFTFVALELIQSPCKESVRKGLEKAKAFYGDVGEYGRIMESGFFGCNEKLIKSSGYVVDTLECALWSLMNTESYSECVLRAVNFGYDTDTAGCVAGALSGLLYGCDGMSDDWKKRLRGKEVVEKVIQHFCSANGID